MQTFLPYPDFARSARCLDNRRLGKQRVEAYQILRTLERSDDPQRRGWRNHPAVLMWRGYEDALRLYMNVMITEWVARGFRNTMALAPVEGAPEAPAWLSDPAFHAAHRSNLLRKDPAHYGQFGWTEAPDMPYVWPTARQFGGNGE
ncbi:MAG TPA: MSMEG_6728 family protein [Ktedonobacterales bacterium]